MTVLHARIGELTPANDFWPVRSGRPVCCRAQSDDRPGSRAAQAGGDEAQPSLATDITYVPMARGFVYIVAIVDWFTRRVLAWRVWISLDAGFCMEALEEALARYGKPTVFNSDQCS